MLSHILYLHTVIMKIWHHNVIVFGNSSIVGACKLVFFISPGTKFVQQFPIGLENQNAAGFVVNNNDMTIVVHGNALWSQ